MPLERRLRKLLEFYEKEMPRTQAAILGIVSFFRSLAPTSAIVALARRLPAVAEATADHSDSELRAVMHKLGRQHLLIGDPMGEYWSCHPILRDHFRQNLLGWSPAIAKGAAGFLTQDFHDHWSTPNSSNDAASNLLTARPSRDRPRNFMELEPIVTAVELLLEANDFVGADQLFRERLDDGNVFRQLALPGEGMRCALSFVRDEERRGHCNRKLGKPRLAAYARQVGVFARQTGEFEFGLSCLRESTNRYEELGLRKEVCISLQNWTGLLNILGRLSEAERYARRAVEEARTAEAYAELKGSLTYLGTILGKMGHIREALSEFETARKFEISTGRQVENLFGNRGSRFADLLLRLDRCEQAQWVTEANLQICRENNWQEETAQCWSVLGEIASHLGREAAKEGNLDTARLQFGKAQGLLKAAEKIFRAGHIIAQIPRILLAEEALNIAAPRQMRLDHTDALLLRSRILLDEAVSGNFPDEGSTRPSERAIDDADVALQIASECSYAWGLRDALHLLAHGHKLLGSDDRASTYGRDAQLWSTRLADPDTARSIRT
jgi:tetratricopeptide (TPR) repeat protein